MAESFSPIHKKSARKITSQEGLDKVVHYSLTIP
jgi:hypothetical protein